MLPSPFAWTVIAIAAAPMLAFGGMWVARATDAALSGVTLLPRPMGFGVAAGTAIALCAGEHTLDAAGAIAAATFGAIAACDTDQFIIPDGLVLALTALGLAFHPFAPGADAIQLAVAGAVTGALGWLFSAFMRWRHGQIMFCPGDVKLMAAIATNVPAVAVAPIIALGCILAIGRHLRRAGAPEPAYIPFGPYLVAALAAALLVAPAALPSMTI